jgi:hypothetical protein
MRARSRTRARLVVVAAVLVVALVGAGVVIWNAVRGPGGTPVAGPPCQVRTYGLDLEQAANATTIAGVGKRMGLPDHAVSIALATAYLESNMRNLAHGDRDSLGLFQQRPSQGWGTPAQIMTPHYAAAAFYQHLVKVPGWEVIPVTQAAQRVQRSALPHGYAQFEPKARALAEALTGEVPAGFACRVTIAPGAPAVGLADAMGTELGVRTLSIALDPSRGWTVADWLIGHAGRYKIASVSYAGQQWTAATGRWQPDPPGGLEIQVAFTTTGVK